MKSSPFTFLLGLTALLVTHALGADPAAAATPVEKPLYRFTETEVGAYLGPLRETIPGLRPRIIHLARKNLGQPYELYLLGEMPFETYDPQPLYSLAKSDCLVFAEHTYAMALTRDWAGFMRLLQRIRYRDGHLGVATRNHFTETDWNPSNRWLLRDITTEIGGSQTRRFTEKIDRSKFLLGRYKLKTEIPIEDHVETYVPYADVALATPVLQEGDCIEIVRGIVKPGVPENEIFGGAAWIGHVGLAARGPAGELHMIHSIAPEVREESLAQFIARETEHNAERDAAGKPRLLGFKFLRLADDPLANLRELDGADTPRVTLPGGAKLP